MVRGQGQIGDIITQSSVYIINTEKAEALAVGRRRKQDKQ